MGSSLTILILIASVLIGAVLGYFFNKYQKNPKLLLTFSGAFLLTVTLLELFPEIYNGGSTLNIGLFVILGVFIQILLETITKGAEHGHVHFHGNHGFPWALFLGLFIHSFIEGIPIHYDEHNHLLTAIFIHNIPIAIILYTFLLKLTQNLGKQALFLIIFALASPIGYWIGDYLPKDWLLPLMAIVAGIFLHISTVIIFESSDGHNLKFKKLAAILAGFALAYFTLSH